MGCEDAAHRIWPLNRVAVDPGGGWSSHGVGEEQGCQCHERQKGSAGLRQKEQLLESSQPNNVAFVGARMAQYAGTLEKNYLNRNNSNDLL